MRHLLTIAKNPQTIQYLQKGIDNKQPNQNGVGTHEVKLASGSSKPVKPTPMLVKISNYGNRPHDFDTLSSITITVYICVVGWDQSDQFVKLYITDLPGISEVTNDNIKTDFSEK